MPRQNPCGCLPGHRCMYGSSCMETNISAHYRALETAWHGVYPRVFTPGPSPQSLYLVVSAGLISFTIASSIFRLKSPQLQSTRRNEIGHGGKFSRVERVFVAHVWVAALALHRRVTGQSSSSSRSSSTSNGDSTSPRQASRPSRTASTATTSAATESAHHQPNRLSRTRPMNTAPER